MSEHQYWRERDGAWSDPISDPGASGAIGVTRSGVCEIATAAAETRTLANPAFQGQDVMLTLKTDGGDCTITVADGYNGAADTSLVLNDAGDTVCLRGIKSGSNLRWRLVAADGVTANVWYADDSALVFGTGKDAALKWNGSYLEGGPVSGMWAGAPSPAAADYASVAHDFMDDFDTQAPVDANLFWTEMDDGTTGTHLLQDAANGVISLVTANADNDYHAIRSIGESWLFALGKKMWFEIYLKLAEANTSTASWWVGFTDTLTTGGFLADAGGPLASYDGCLIYKAEDMVVKSEASNAGTQTEDATLGTAVTDQWHKVGFYFDGAATTGIITPYFDGTAGTPHGVALTGLAEMNLVLGCKAGSGDVETLEVDYAKCVQLR